METLLEKQASPPTMEAGSNLQVKTEKGKEGARGREADDAAGPQLSAGAFSTYYTWRGHGTVRLNCGHGSINANSRVFASVSEYNTDPRLNRFIGNAFMQVFNVAPYNGGVVIALHVGYNSALNVRVDVLVEP